MEKWSTRYNGGNNADISRKSRGSITLLGEKGTVKVGGKAVNHIDHWCFKDKSSDDDLIENATTKQPVFMDLGIVHITKIC